MKTSSHLRLVTDPAVSDDAVVVALATLEKALDAAPVNDLPDALGALARLSALAQLRLSRHAQLAPVHAEERLLNVKEAAARLGMSMTALYHRAAELPFTVRQGRRLRFSESALSAWIRKRAR